MNNSEIAQLYDSGLSLLQISQLINKPYNHVRNAVKNNGNLRTRNEGIKLAADQGRLGLGMLGKTRQFTESHKANISKSKIKWAEENANGISNKKSGYAEYTRGENKGRYVHTIMMEKRIGRKLLNDECVHHIDGNRSNNSENNLALVTISGHARLHRFEDVLQGKHRKRKNNGRFS